MIYNLPNLFTLSRIGVIPPPNRFPYWDHPARRLCGLGRLGKVDTNEPVHAAREQVSTGERDLGPRMFVE